MTHIIASVDFAGARRMGLTGEDATLVCSCGETMQAGDFWLHRKETRAGRGRRNLVDGEFQRKPIPWSIDGRRGSF